MRGARRKMRAKDPGKNRVIVSGDLGQRRKETKSVGFPNLQDKPTREKHASLWRCRGLRVEPEEEKQLRQSQLQSQLLTTGKKGCALEDTSESQIYKGILPTMMVFG